MASWFKSFVVSLGCTLAACSGIPEEASTAVGPQDTGPPASTQGNTTEPQPTTTAGTAGSQGGSGGTSEGLDTTDGVLTSGPMTEGMTTEGTTTGDPPPNCDGVSCPNNQVCVDGGCVSACTPWGDGNYDYCLNAYGAFDTEAVCGQQSTCIFSDAPIAAAVCSTQGCTNACDCPAPPATGNAVVTCANITQSDNNADCYLSCANQEQCPDGMVCRNDFVCTNDVTDLPTYGNCGGVAGGCIDSTCFDNGQFSMCVETCGNAGDCPAGPPGANPPACGTVLFPPAGNDCYLPCQNSGDCPFSMVCVEASGTNICIWP